MKKSIAIIGSGPAGYAAGLYTGRADILTTIFTGHEPGGQLTKTTEIENFPGAPKGITGPKLMLAMQEQATTFGCEIVYENVEKVLPKNNHFVLTTESKEYQFDAVIMTMGANPRMLEIGEEKYWGKGLSTCAVCDAAFYREKIAYVVGGGDAAIEDVMALTKFAKEVKLLVRGEKLRASVAMQKKLVESKVQVLYKTQVTGVLGQERIEGLILDEDGVNKQVKTDGLFLAIGHTPATSFIVESGVAMDEHGYIKTGINYPTGSKESSEWHKIFPTMTTVAGIFAAGDCVDFRYRQAAVASGMGVMAALDAEKWLETQ